MRLDLQDTLAHLDQLLEKESHKPNPGGFTVRLQRLRDIIAENMSAEPSLASISTRVFTGVTKNSLRTTLMTFRKTLETAAKAAGQEFQLIRPDARGLEMEEVICHFEGKRLPSDKGSATRESIENLRQTILESPRSIPDVIRIFVSFSTKDEKLIEELVRMLETTWGDRRSHRVSFWNFHQPKKGGLLAGEDSVERVRQEIAGCPLGLLLLSPDYMASGFIREHELAAYFPQVPGKYPVLVNLRNSPPGAPHTPGEKDDKTYIFSADGQDFTSMGTKKRKEQFAMALNDHIEALCQKHFPSPDETPIPAATPLGIRQCRDLKNLIPPQDHEDGFLIESKIATSDETGIDTVEDLISWANDPERAHYFALLGEVGSGKTTAALMFARALNEKNGTVQVYYFDMRYANYAGLLEKSANRPQLEQVMAAILLRKGDSKATAADYLRAVREERAVLIFDGLDEVFVSMNLSEQDALMSGLLSALPLSAVDHSGAGKLLLACRTAYFRSHIAERGAFTLQGREGLDEATKGTKRAGIEKARMLPFTPEQIQDYFRKNVPNVPVEEIWTRLLGLHDLLDLATRPYLLNLIRRQLPRLNEMMERNVKIRSIDLYAGFIQDWSHERNRFHNIIAPEDKIALMARLSVWMWRDARKTLPAAELEAWLLDELIAHPRWRVIYADFLKARESEAILSDFRTASFISRWDGDSFRFAHTSLQEYFLASHLVRALEQGNADEWLLPQVNRETLDFAAELFVQRAEESPAARGRLEKTLTLLMQENQPGRSENGLAFFLRLHATGESDFSVPGADLHGLDLTAWEFTGTASRPLRLPAVDFSGAKLIRARFRQVEMADSMWMGADLCSAEFVGCGLERADFSGTRLEGGRLRSCRLNGSHLSDSISDGLRVDLPLWETEAAALWRAAATHLLPARPMAGALNACWSLGHRDYVRSAAISPDGKRIISGSGDNSLRICDAATGECLGVLNGHENWVWSVVISPDGTRIVSGSLDNSLRIWDAATGDCLRVLNGHENWVLSVAISPDGTRIVSGSADNSLRIWEAATGECLRVLNKHENSVADVAISPDGTRIVSGSWDNSLRIWDAATGECLRVLNGYVNSVESVAISPDGTRIVSGSGDKSLRIWDAATGECLRVLNGHEDMVTSVAISPDGMRIASGSRENSLRIWDAATGECLRVLNGHENSVMSVAISPDGTRIVSGSVDKSLRIWDAATGDCLRVLNGHENSVTRVAISPDGTRLVSGLRDKSVRVWDAETGRSLDLTAADQKLLEEKDEESPSDTLHHITPSGKELEIAALPDGGYVVLEKATATAPWRIARGKGDYWRYVNYATDGPEGRTLWSADALGPVPEV